MELINFCEGFQRAGEKLNNAASVKRDDENTSSEFRQSETVAALTYDMTEALLISGLLRAITVLF